MTRVPPSWGFRQKVGLWLFRMRLWRRKMHGLVGLGRAVGAKIQGYLLESHWRAVP